MTKITELPNQEKNQNAWRKGNLQILGNIGSGHLWELIKISKMKIKQN